MLSVLKCASWFPIRTYQSIPQSWVDCPKTLFDSSVLESLYCMQISSAEKSNQSEVAALQKEMATLGNSMQNLFSTLDKHLHAVEDQSTEISKRLQAEKAWKTSCAGKVSQAGYFDLPIKSSTHVDCNDSRQLAARHALILRTCKLDVVLLCSFFGTTRSVESGHQQLLLESCLEYNCPIIWRSLNTVRYL